MPTILTPAELLTTIGDRLSRRAGMPHAAGPFVLAVSGHGGAGKSTLAQRTALAHNGIEVGTDEFYLPPSQRGQGLWDLHDWVEIFALLRSLPTADRLRYRWRWYSGETGVVDEPMPALVVIEGIRLIRPEVLAMVDASVWLDCPPEVAGESAKERNRGQGDSQAELDLWDTKWIPEGRAYEQQFAPAEHTTWVVSTREFRT